MAMKRSTLPASAPAADKITARIAELGGWRGETLAAARAAITGAHKDIVEEWKWEVPVWSCSGILCTGEAYKGSVKLTFAKGASVPDPDGLFNASLTGGTRRAIDFHEGDTVPAKKLAALIKRAIAVNRG